jgi:hypothetical protein
MNSDILKLLRRVRREQPQKRLDNFYEKEEK